MSCNFSRGQCVRLQPLWVSLPSYSVSQRSFPIGNFCHYGDSSAHSATAAQNEMGGSSHSLIARQRPATSLPDPLLPISAPILVQPSTAHPWAPAKPRHHRGGITVGSRTTQQGQHRGSAAEGLAGEGRQRCEQLNDAAPTLHPLFVFSVLHDIYQPPSVLECCSTVYYKMARCKRCI